MCNKTVRSRGERDLDEEEAACVWLGKSYSRTAVGDVADRTRSTVPEVLNASCVFPEPVREDTAPAEPERAAGGGLVAFARTWDAAVGKVNGG